MNPNQLFITQKTQEAIRALEAARARAQRERTLLGLAHVVSRVQVNHLARPVPSVRAAMHRLHAEAQRHAARLAAEQLTRYRAEPLSQVNADTLQETIRACHLVFPREAALLRGAYVAIAAADQSHT